eukprot:3543804-Prymnesium_polylepis.3
MVTVTTDEICAAIKDGFTDTRCAHIDSLALTVTLASQTRAGQHIEPQTGPHRAPGFPTRAGQHIEPQTHTRSHLDLTLGFTFTYSATAPSPGASSLARCVLEPAGALAIAGMKRFCQKTNLRDQTFVAIASGANMDFDVRDALLDSTFV